MSKLCLVQSNFGQNILEDYVEKNPKIEFKEAVNQTRRQNNVVEKDPHMTEEWMVKIKFYSRDSNLPKIDEIDTIMFIIIQIISIIIIFCVFQFSSSSTSR